MAQKIYKIGKRRVRVSSPEQDHIIGDVINTVKDVVGEVKKVIKTDDELINTRQKVFDIFIAYKLRAKDKDPVAEAHRLAQKDIPNKKLGGNYNAEYKRLYEYVIDQFNRNGKPELAEIFERTVPVFDENNHDVSVIRELLQGKVRATPEQPQAQDIASELANQNIQLAAKQSDIAARPSSATSSVILKPFVPLMRKGLSDAGFVPPSGIDPLATMFYEKIVKPASQYTFDANYLDEAITNAILTFVATLQQKREAGEQMNSVYTKIADTATALQEKTKNVARDAAGNKIGGFVLDNAMLLGIGVAAIVLIMLAKK